MPIHRGKEDRPKFYRAYPISVEDDNGESNDYYCLANERGMIYSKAEVFELFEKVIGFYEREDSNQLAEDYNELSNLEEYISTVLPMLGITIKQNEKGKYLIPPAKYKYKNFNLYKREWSCKCGWCGRKVSTQVDEGYYLINNSSFVINDRACSEDCTKLIWKDGFKNWVHENGYQKYFELD